LRLQQLRQSRTSDMSRCTDMVRSGRRKKQIQGTLRNTAVCALFDRCFDTTRVVASSTLLNSSLAEPLWSSSVFISSFFAMHIVSFRQFIFVHSLILLLYTILLKI
jgi:hypothetical protein